MSSPPDPTRLSRRGLMRSGLLGGALILAGSLGLAFRRTVLRASPAAGLSVLTLREYSILAAIADRICPAVEGGAPGASAMGVAERADALLARGPREPQEAIKVLLAVFENGLTGAVFGERLTPFTQLSGSEQDRVLEQWHLSSVAFRRTAYSALNTLVSALYYGDARVWPHIGYPGPPSPAMLRLAYSFNLVDFSRLRPDPSSADSSPTPQP